MRRFDHAIPPSPRQKQIALVLFVVAMIAIFGGMPKLTDAIDQSYSPEAVALPTPTPPPPPAPPEGEVTHISTYATSELHNVRVAVSLKNTSDRVNYYNVTLETATTHAVIVVPNVPPGGVGYGDGYVVDKKKDYFVKDRIPDLPLVVVSIQRY